MNPVLTCSLLVALVHVACNNSESSSGKKEGDGNGGATSAASSAAGSGGAGNVAGRRTPVACAKHLTESERISASVGYPVKAEPGSWGGVAPALRALPPDATLCGAQYFVAKQGNVSKAAGSVIIRVFAMGFMADAS